LPKNIIFAFDFFLKKEKIWLLARLICSHGPAPSQVTEKLDPSEDTADGEALVAPELVTMIID
jgi:hypothetical protein